MYVKLKDGVYYYDEEKYTEEGRDSNIIFLKSESGNSMLVISASKLYVFGKINSWEGVALD